MADDLGTLTSMGNNFTSGHTAKQRKFIIILVLLFALDACQAQDSDTPRFAGCADEALQLREGDPNRKIIAARRLQGCTLLISVPTLCAALLKEKEPHVLSAIEASISLFSEANNELFKICKSSSAEIRLQGTLSLPRPAPSQFDFLMEDVSEKVRIAYFGKIRDDIRRARKALSRENDKRIIKSMNSILAIHRKFRTRRQSIEQILADERQYQYIKIDTDFKNGK